MYEYDQSIEYGNKIERMIQRFTNKIDNLMLGIWKMFDNFLISVY